MDSHCIDFFVNTGIKYGVKTKDVMCKYGDILECLSYSFPNMNKDWYIQEADRRLKRFYNNKLGESNEEKKQV